MGPHSKLLLLLVLVVVALASAVDLPNKETGTCARSCPVLLLDRWQVHLHDL